MSNLNPSDMSTFNLNYKGNSGSSGSGTNKRNPITALTGGPLPDPSVVRQQKEAYCKLLEDQYERSLEGLELQFAAELSALEKQAEQHRITFELQQGLERNREQLLIEQKYKIKETELEGEARFAKQSVEKEILRVKFEYEGRRLGRKAQEQKAKNDRRKEKMVFTTSKESLKEGQNESDVSVNQNTVVFPDEDSAWDNQLRDAGLIAPGGSESELTKLNLNANSTSVWGQIKQTVFTGKTGPEDSNRGSAAGAEASANESVTLDADAFENEPNQRSTARSGTRSSGATRSHSGTRVTADSLKSPKSSVSRKKKAHDASKGTASASSSSSSSSSKESESILLRRGSSENASASGNISNSKEDEVAIPVNVYHGNRT